MYSMQKCKAKLSPLTVHEDTWRLHKGQISLRRLQEEAQVCIQLTASVCCQVVPTSHYFIYTKSPFPFASTPPRHSLLFPFISADAALPVCPLAPLPTAFHVTAPWGVAEGGPTASLSGVFAAVWAQLSRCDKESIKKKHFHTNYGKIMKALVKGRMKVRLSLV